MSEYKLSWSDNTIAWCNPNINSVLDAVTKLLSNPEGPPEVIVCYNDSIALMVSKILTDKGYTIPNDIAITGYDNLNPPDITFPLLPQWSFL